MKRDPLKLLRTFCRLPRRIVSAPIKLYRKYVSHLKRTPSCRFTPTCSEYALEAINEWGVIIGGVLALRRILRCNPFGGCGHDPVPVRKKKKVSRDTEDHT